jgi:hypothetical protein
MSVDAARTEPARIRELMLANLFAVFNEREPKRRLKAITRTTWRT